MLTAFVIFTGDGWNDIMYVFVKQSGYFAAVYFVSLVIISNLVLLNMFLAVLLHFITTAMEQER